MNPELIDINGGLWDAFVARCLEPMEAGRGPDAGGLEPFEDPELLDVETAYQGLPEGLVMITRDVTHRDDRVYVSGLVKAQGVDPETVFDAPRRWAREAVRAKRYRRGAGARPDYWALGSTGWRSPTLELYFSKGPETACFTAWETPVMHDRDITPTVIRTLKEAQNVG